MVRLCNGRVKSKDIAITHIKGDLLTGHLKSDSMMRRITRKGDMVGVGGEPIEKRDLTFAVPRPIPIVKLNRKTRMKSFDIQVLRLSVL